MKHLFAALLIGLISASASAVPVRWELHQAVLSTVLYPVETVEYEITGSFIYDADLAPGDRYSEVNILGEYRDYIDGRSGFCSRTYTGPGGALETTCDTSHTSSIFLPMNEWPINSPSPGELPVYLNENGGIDEYNGHYLELNYAEELTNAGGIVHLLPGTYDPFTDSYTGGSGEYGCSLEGCSFYDGGSTQGNALFDTFIGTPEDCCTITTSAYLVGTVVPIPAAVWLFGSALAGLGWLRRKPPAN